MFCAISVPTQRLKKRRTRHSKSDLLGFELNWAKRRTLLQYMGATAPRLGTKQMGCDLHRYHSPRVFCERNEWAETKGNHRAFASRRLANFPRNSRDAPMALGFSNWNHQKPAGSGFFCPRSLSARTVAKCFTTAERHLENNCGEAATAAVDEWLIESIPSLARRVSLGAIQTALRLAIKRRLGKPLLHPVKSAN